MRGVAMTAMLLYFHFISCFAQKIISCSSADCQHFNDQIKSTSGHPTLKFQHKNGRAANPSSCRDMTEAITIASQTFALIKYLLAFPLKNNGLEAKDICGMRQRHAVFNLCNEWSKDDADGGNIYEAMWEIPVNGFLMCLEWKRWQRRCFKAAAHVLGKFN